MDAEDYSSACAFSLACQEDGADLDDGGLFFFYAAVAEDDEEEYMEQLVCKESSFCSSSPVASDDDSPAASEDWFDRARLASVKWILETRGCFGFSHRTAYLAIAYFDRFCLRRRVDRAAMPWATQLLSIACMSLAAKMEEYPAPPLSEFHADYSGGGGGYEFSCASIRRMELLVLSTLGWRMNAVTPFDYLPCFSSRLRRDNGRGGGAGEDGTLVSFRAIGFIFAIAEAGSVLDYRPSTVAASAILAASYGSISKHALDHKMRNLSPSCLLEKENVHACYSLMVGGLNRSNKRLLQCSESSEAATSTYDSVDDVADTATATTAAARNKRVRVDLPGIR